MLDSSVVNQDINATELLGSLFDDVFAISWFGQVGKDEFGLDSIAGNRVLDLFDLFLRCESIEDDVGTSSRQLFSNAKSNTTQRASYNGGFTSQES